MPLEFALRPHFDLERTTPRKRKAPRRFARLAVPVAAYWLAIAGATHAFIASTKERPVRAQEQRAVAPSTEQDGASPAYVAVEEAPSSEPSSEPVPPTAPYPAPQLPPAPPSEPRMEPAPFVAIPPAPALVAPARVAPAFVAPAAPSRPPAAPPARTADVLPSPSRSSVAHAGPRISDPLAALADAEPRPDEPSVAAISPKPDRDEPLPSVSLPSCEAAAASAEQSIDFHARSSTPDLPREAFAAVLDCGGYLARCAIPARTALDICAAVQDGRVVGVSVSSRPHAASVDACVRRAVAALRFPKSPRIDVARTRFEAAR